MSDHGTEQGTEHRRSEGGVTLAELLALPELRLSCRIGGDGLGRGVRWAHSTELLDPSMYLRGGELVCTVGASLVDDDACGAFVEAVSRARASGICFGAGDVHDDVPAGLLAACRERGLPLLVAPLGVPFLAITEYLAQSLVAAESAAGARGGVLVADLLSRIRTHAPTRELLEMAAVALRGRLVLSDAGRILLEAAGPVDGTAATGSDATTATGSGATVSVRAPSPAGTALTWTGAAAAAAPSQTLVATLAHLLDVSRHERDVEQDLHRERVGQLLWLVGDRLAHPSALGPPLAEAGLAPAELVFSVWPSGASRMLASSMGGVPLVLGEAPSGSLAVTTSDGPVRETSVALGIACGISRAVPLSDSARGIGEARAAFEMARRHGGFVGPEGLTSLEGLLEQQPPERLRPFVDQLLGPLVRSDSRRRTGYVRTLATYLRCDGSLTATAREEFVHVNTVRHRLERIRDLTGRDPLVFTDRVALAIAMWARSNDRSREG